MKRAASGVLALVLSGLSGTALANQTPSGHDADPQDSSHSEHHLTASAEPGDFGEAEKGHSGAAEHGHVPHFSDINWIQGMIGEKADAEPGLLWRAPGTPVPLAALFLNTAILFYLLGRFGGPAIKKGLFERKKRIAGDIEAARAMRVEAEQQLAHYESQLSQMTAEMERIKSDMREQASMERTRILEEAKARREALEREAHVAIGQELSAAREAIARVFAREAVAAARKLVGGSLTETDHQRLAGDLLASVQQGTKNEVRS